MKTVCVRAMIRLSLALIIFIGVGLVGSSTMSAYGATRSSRDTIDEDDSYQDDSYNDDYAADENDGYDEYDDEYEEPRRPKKRRPKLPPKPNSPYRFRNESEFFIGPTLWALTFDMKTTFATGDMQTVTELLGLTISEVDFADDFGLDATQLSVMPVIGVRWTNGNVFTLRGTSIRLKGNQQVRNGLIFGDILWGECDTSGTPAVCSNPAVVKTEIDLDSLAMMYYREFGPQSIVFHFGVGVNMMYMRTLLDSDDIVNQPDADNTTLLPNNGYTDEQKIPLPLPLIGLGAEAAVYQGISAFAAVDGTWINIAYVIDWRAGLTFTPGPWPHIRSEIGYRAFRLHADGEFLGWSITGDMRIDGLYFDFYVVL